MFVEESILECGYHFFGFLLGTGSEGFIAFAFVFTEELFEESEGIVP